MLNNRNAFQFVQSLDKYKKPCAPTRDQLDETIHPGYLYRELQT